MQAAFDETPDHELPAIGARYIEYFVSSAAERNKLQELLWNDDTGPTIPRKQRHDIARSLDVHDLYIAAGQFDLLLDRLFVLDDALGAIHVFFGEPDRSLRAEIAGHVHRNPGDWSPYELFDRLGAFDCSDRRFRLLLEGLVSPQIRHNGPPMWGPCSGSLRSLRKGRGSSHPLQRPDRLRHARHQLLILEDRHRVRNDHDLRWEQLHECIEPAFNLREMTIERTGKSVLEVLPVFRSIQNVDRDAMPQLFVRAGLVL
jgi:hypothetical protein